MKIQPVGNNVLCVLSRFRLSVTPWTAARQVPLSMGFSRQEYWSGLPCLPSRDLPNSGIEPRLPHCWQIFFTIWTICHLKPKNTGVGSLFLLQGESSQPRNQTGISCIAGKFFTSWVTRDACWKQCFGPNSPVDMISQSITSLAARDWQPQLRIRRGKGVDEELTLSFRWLPD